MWIRFIFGRYKGHRESLRHKILFGKIRISSRVWGMKVKSYQLRPGWLRGAALRNKSRKRVNIRHRGQNNRGPRAIMAAVELGCPLGTVPNWHSGIGHLHPSADPLLDGCCRLRKYNKGKSTAETKLWVPRSPNSWSLGELMPWS